MLAYNAESLLKEANLDVASNKHHYLFTKIKNQLYAVPMDGLRGLIESAYVHRTGENLGLTCGKVDAGNEFVRALDLGECLGLGAVRRENPFVILIEFKRHGVPSVWGLILDELLAVMQVAPENIQCVEQSDEPYVNQILTVSGTQVKALDTARIASDLV